MKKKLNICWMFLFLPMVWCCQTYRPIEKVTLPDDPNSSKKENFSRQLAELNGGDQISITLDNEIKHELVFKSVVGDTLNATFQKPKDGIPIQVPMNRVQEVKVEKFNWPFTLLGSGVMVLCLSIILASSTYSYTW